MTHVIGGRSVSEKLTCALVLAGHVDQKGIHLAGLRGLQGGVAATHEGLAPGGNMPAWASIVSQKLLGLDEGMLAAKAGDHAIHENTIGFDNLANIVGGEEEDPADAVFGLCGLAAEQLPLEKRVAGPAGAGEQAVALVLATWAPCLYRT